MDPDDWQQPQQFRPERFLDQSGYVIGRDQVIPFSLGIFHNVSSHSVLQLYEEKAARSLSKVLRGTTIEQQVLTFLFKFKLKYTL